MYKKFLAIPKSGASAKKRQEYAYRIGTMYEKQKATSLAITQYKSNTVKYPKDYRNYDGVWRAHVLSMTNVQTNKQTDLVYADYRFGVGLSENDFVKGRLSRLR